jgi:OmpA-OmpF porin, OOP family
VKGIKIIITLFFFLISLSGMIAQPVEQTQSMRAGQLKNFGKNAFNQGDYSSAAMYYESLCELKPKNYKAAFRLGESYRLSKDYRSAEPAYLKAYELKPDKNALALFHYATMLKMNGQFEKSDVYYAKFRKEYKGKDKSAYLKMIGNNTKAAEFVKTNLNNPVKVDVRHLGDEINTGHVEAAPLFLNDSVVLFSSLRTDKKYFLINPEDSTSDEPLRKFYSAIKINDQWQFRGESTLPFISEKFHISNGTFSPDGKRFYFTQCKRNRKSKTICAIYVCKLESGSWSEPESLGDQVNLSGYTSTQPTVAVESQRNRETIYFISDREGGRGNYDIWYTMYDTKKKAYTNPLNAGAKINTAGDEMTPWFDWKTRTMYFSSNGWQGMGGMDVFKTTGELKKWSPPENLGTPLNSSYDDLYYVLAPGDKATGMLVSNRQVKGSLGTGVACCDDLFEVRWLDAVRIQLEGLVWDESDDRNPVLIRGAKVFLELKSTDDSTWIPVNGNFTNAEGKFDFDLIPGREYRVMAKKEGFLAVTKEISTSGMTRSGTINTELRLKEAPLEATSLQNIYYEYNMAKLTDAAMRSIDTTLFVILQNNPDHVIELSSHTDAIGKDEDNMKLSQARAESVVQYLIAKGINPKQLHARGFGESKPVAPNQNPDGSDNPEGRQLNRRTEFRIVGKLLPDGTIMEPGNF